MKHQPKATGYHGKHVKAKAHPDKSVGEWPKATGYHGKHVQTPTKPA